MAKLPPINLNNDNSAQPVVVTGYDDGNGNITRGMPAGGGGGGGDASAANQTLQLTQATTTNTNLGPVTETAPTTDTASSGLNGRLQRLAQRITSLIALLPTALGAGGGLKVDGSGTALPVSGTVAASGVATGAIVDLGTTITDAAATNVVEDTTAKTGIGLFKGIKNLLKLINDKLVAGTIIGNVNVSAITAGETHLGETGGNLITVSVEFTREANATPYSAGDAISSSAAGPVLLELTNAVRINGGSAYVTGCAVVFNVKSVTPRIRVHFFNASPAAANISGDNLPIKELYADASKRLRYIELPAMITAADVTNSDMSRAFITPPPWLPVQAAGGSRSIFVLLETLDAVTLTSGSKVTVVATFDNN
jgi:hypothetical protein